jgi:hypothetical protein
MNYKLLSDAIDFYRNRGYYYVPEAPWLIDKPAYYATKPGNVPDVKISVDDKFFCASGEQSFLQMLFNDQPIKKAVCVTPCIRNEPQDEWHKLFFMKVELINADEPTRANLYALVHDAMAFFEQHVSVKLVTKDKDGRECHDGQFIDIVEKYSRKELGSYGIRHAVHPDGVSSDVSWIYGTGCAEPQLSQVIRHHRDQVMQTHRDRIGKR